MATEDAIRKIVRDILRQALTEYLPAQTSTSPASYHAPWTGVAYESHPSRQLFNIREATVTPVTPGDLLEFVEDQRCSIEKNKSCDHCGMCQHLGF
ncbi:MAG: hypothetical protein ACREEM_12885 [Blastocatellia bacterium]